MVRELHVYPKGVLLAGLPGTWLLDLSVYEHATGVTSYFTRSDPSAHNVEADLRDLKLAFDLVVADSDTDQDVFDALTVDDIRPGPQYETVWSNFVVRADGIYDDVLPSNNLEFWAGWRKQDTAQTRSDARRALVTQRGWTVVAGTVHQHEGDSTVTDE